MIIPLASAEVFIPPHEYLGYFDSNGIYTVVGNVKNENPFAVIPTITVSVMDGDEILSKTIKHVPLGPEKEIPFKIKFFEVTGNIPILIPAELSFKKTNQNVIPIEVLYDKTLIKHKDGHITGRIQNTGNEIIHFPKIYAVIHHGGSGTTHQGLKYGCATMIIPHIIDQFVWNKIIYNIGAGPKGIKVDKITTKNL